MPQVRWSPAAAKRATMDHPIELVVGERIVTIEYGATLSSYAEPGDVATLNTRAAAKMAGSAVAVTANQD